MNGLDIAILVVLGMFLLAGLIRGLLKELCSLAGLGVGAVLAFRFHGPLAQSLAESLRLPEKVCVIATFLALLLASILLFAILGALLSRFVNLIFLGGINRIVGGLFGLVQGTVLLAILLFGFSLITLPDFLQRQKEGSQLAPPFVRLGEEVFQGSRALFRGGPGV